MGRAWREKGGDKAKPRNFQIRASPLVPRGETRILVPPDSDWVPGSHPVAIRLRSGCDPVAIPLVTYCYPLYSILLGVSLNDMIELIQFPWSPFCIVQRRILEFSGSPFKITNIPNGDRSLVWRLTRQRYYGVPVIRDGRNVVFELDENSQVVAKYLESKLKLGLFPYELEGVQSILWRHIENEIEGPCFKLNDVYWKELVPPF